MLIMEKATQQIFKIKHLMNQQHLQFHEDKYSNACFKPSSSSVITGQAETIAITHQLDAKFIFIQIRKENSCNTAWIGTGRQGEDLPAHHSSTLHSRSSSWSEDVLLNSAVVLLTHSSEILINGTDLEVFRRSCHVKSHERLSKRNLLNGSGTATSFTLTFQNYFANSQWG